MRLETALLPAERPQRPVAPPASPVERRWWPRAVLCVHLMLSPLIFLRLTGDSFELPKAGLLLLTVIAVLAIALTSLALRAPWPGADAAAVLRRAWGGGRFALAVIARDPFAAGVCLFVASAALSTATSTSPRVSLHGTPYSRSGLITIAAYAALFFLTRWLFPRPADAVRLLLAPVVAAALVSAYAVVQVLNLDPLTARVPSAELMRPFSTMGNPNFLGAFEVIVLPLVAYFAHRTARDRQWLLTAVFASIGALCAIALALSLTRAAWLAIIPAMVLLAVGWWRAGARRSARVLVVMALGAAIVLGGAAMVSKRGQFVLDVLRARAAVLTVDNQRHKLWSTSFAVFREAPLLGVGPDTFHFGYDRNRTAGDFMTAWNTTFFKAHNDVIQVLATQGVLGGAALLLVVVGFLRAVGQAWRGGSPEDRTFVVGLLASATGFSLQLLLSFVIAGAGPLFVTIGALISAAARDRGAPAPHVTREGGWLGAGLIAGALLFLAICTINFDRAEPLDSREGLAVLGLLAVLAAAIAGAFACQRRERPRPKERPAVGPVAAARPLVHRAAVAGVVLAIWVAAGALAYVTLVRHYVGSVFAENGFRATEMRVALEHFERAVALDGGHDQHWTFLGSAYELLAQRTTSSLERQIAWRRARQAFAEAVRLVPEESHHHVRLGRILASGTGAERVSAYASFDEGIRRNPANVYFYLTAASAALEMGSRFRARQYAERAVALYPEFGLALLQLGHVDRLDGRLEQADALLRRAMAVPWSGPESALRPNAIEEFAVILIARGRLAEAHTLAYQDVLADPNDPARRALLVTVLERLGKTDEARDEARRLVEQHPGYEPARRVAQRLAPSASLAPPPLSAVETRPDEPRPRFDRQPSPDYPGALR